MEIDPFFLPGPLYSHIQMKAVVTIEKEQESK